MFMNNLPQTENKIKLPSVIVVEICYVQVTLKFLLPKIIIYNGTERKNHENEFSIYGQIYCQSLF